MSVTLLERVKNGEGVREGRVFKNNLKIRTSPPTTISENEATLQGLITDFFPPAFFDDEVDLFFSYFPVENEENKESEFVGTFSGSQQGAVVSKEIAGLTRNTTYEFTLFAEIDNVRIRALPRTFRTGAFEIGTEEATNISETEATFVGKLERFQGLIFENSGPFDIVSKNESGAITFENQQQSESPLFILDGLSNEFLRTGINLTDKLVSIEANRDSTIGVSQSTDFLVSKDEKTATFSTEEFDLESPISREITAGFEFKEQGSSRLNSVVAVNPPNESGDLFEATVSLEPNTDYEFRAYGTIGSFERVRGDFIEFSTLEQEIVELETGESNNVGITDVELNGEVKNIEPSGTSVDAGFRYGTSVGNNTSSLQSINTSPQSYSADIGNLEAGTAYDYQAFVQGQENTYVGEVKSFQTEAINIETLPQPSSQEEPSKQPTEGTAFLFGEIIGLNPDASGADAEFQVRKEGEEIFSQTVDAGTQPEGTFDVTVTSLEEGETYEYQLSATDPQTGISEIGSIQTFQTVPLGVETLDPASVSRTEATLNGAITNLNTSGTQDVYFEYKEETASSFQEIGKVEVSQAVNFDETLTGLTEATVYEYRAVVEKNGATVRGNTKTFQTNAVEVSALATENITAGTATLNGELTFVSNELSSVSVLFDYKEPSEKSSIRIEADESPLSGTGTFSLNVEELDPGQTYEVRGVADPDSAREQRSDAVTFTTDKITVETDNVPSSRTTESLTIGGELTEFEGSFANGDVTVGHEYIPLGSGDIDVSGTRVVSGTLSSLGTFETTLPDLQQDRTYLVRSFATGGGATAFGNLEGMSTKLND